MGYELIFIEDPTGIELVVEETAANEFELFIEIQVGIDGKTPFIGENGNWWIGDVDTGVPTTTGEGGLTPTQLQELADTTAHINSVDETKHSGTQVSIDSSTFSGKLDATVNTIQKLAQAINDLNLQDGADGLTPTIGGNGNWFIGANDTGVKAEGVDGYTPQKNVDYFDGAPGYTPVKGTDYFDGGDGITPHIGGDGNWYIGLTDTGIKAAGTDGDDGISPHIGVNGNWYIGVTDTGVKAEGVNGNDGVGISGITLHATNGLVKTYRITFTNATTFDFDVTDGENGNDGTTPEIGVNGNWYIGAVDTGIKAQGTDGDPGITASTTAPATPATGALWLDIS